MMPLRVARKTCIATDVFLFELAPTGDADLPSFDAGSHAIRCATARASPATTASPSNAKPRVGAARSA
jgi:hypothetical protein